MFPVIDRFLHHRTTHRELHTPTDKENIKIESLINSSFPLPSGCIPRNLSNRNYTAIQMTSSYRTLNTKEENSDDQNNDVITAIEIDQISNSVLSIPQSHTHTNQNAIDFPQSSTYASEDLYEDTETKALYIRPYSGEILELCDTLLSEGEYKGIGLSLKVRIQEQLCDVVYLKKKKDQVTFELQQLSEEKPGMLASWSEFCFSNEEKKAKIKNRIENQKEIAFKMNHIFNKHYRDWKYGNYIVCDSKMLFQLEAFGDEAKEIHAVIFYYKKANNNL